MKYIRGECRIIFDPGSSCNTFQNCLRGHSRNVHLKLNLTLFTNGFYLYVKRSTASSFLFTDVDKCLSSDSCGANSVRNNTVGSYRCECLTGLFVADCSPQNPPNRICVDKN